MSYKKSFHASLLITGIAFSCNTFADTLAFASVCGTSAMGPETAFATVTDVTCPAGGATAEASLPEGSLKVTATNEQQGFGSGGGNSANANIRDDITLNGTGITNGIVDAPITVLLNLAVDGAFSSNVIGQPEHIQDLRAGLTLVGGPAAASGSDFGFNFDGTSVNWQDLGTGNGLIDVVSTDPNDFRFILSAEVTLLPGNDADLAISATLFAFPLASVSPEQGVFQTETIDFGNTGLLEIILPEGVDFVSDSGVLLSTPVPLPAPFLLLGSALVGLGLFKRRTK